MSKPPAYVGVSGITTPAQAHALIDAWPVNAPAQSLMIGVLASSKTLCGQTNKYPLRYPKREDIASVFVEDPRCLNLVHVACDSDPSTVDGNRIPPEIDMVRAFTAGGPLCHGVQLNGATARLRWQVLSDFRKMCPKASRLVLQVGPRWLNNRVHAASSLTSLVMYVWSITDILIDVSSGRGMSIAIADAQRLADETKASLDHYGVNSVTIGIAGGLCADTLPTVAVLVREHALSIDAEGRLRNERDELDMDKARAYLAAASKMICGDVS